MLKFFFLASSRAAMCRPWRHMDAISSSMAGLAAGSRMLEGSAARISKGSIAGQDVDVAKEMVTMSLAKAQFAASAAVSRTVSKTLGNLVDLVT
jgi:flagellar hook protein FlgE